MENTWKFSLWQIMHCAPSFQITCSFSFFFLSLIIPFFLSFTQRYHTYIDTFQLIDYLTQIVNLPKTLKEPCHKFDDTPGLQVFSDEISCLTNIVMTSSTNLSQSELENPLFETWAADVTLTGILENEGLMLNGILLERDLLKSAP